MVISRILSRLPAGTLLRNVVVLVSGTALGQALGILSAPLITRLFTPDELGVLAAYMSVLTVLLTVSSLRYETAIPLPNDDDTAASLLVLSMALVTVMSALLGLGIWVFGGVLHNIAALSVIAPYAWVVPLGLLGAGVYQTINRWSVRKKAYAAIARTKLHQGLALSLTQVGMGLAGAGPIGLILGDVAGRVSGSGTLIRAAWEADKSTFSRISGRDVRAAAYRYRLFPLVSSVSALVNSVGSQLSVILLTVFYPSEVVGWFALCQKVVSVPSALIGQSVSHVYIGEMSSVSRERPAGLVPLFDRFMGKLFLMGSVLTLLVAVGGPWLFGLVFDKSWAPAGLYARILAPSLLAEFVAFPLSQTLLLLERQGLQLGWDVLRLVSVAGGLWTVSQLGGKAELAVGAVSLATTLAYGAYLLLSRAVIKAVTQARAEGIQHSPPL